MSIVASPQFLLISLGSILALIAVFYPDLIVRWQKSRLYKASKTETEVASRTKKQSEPSQLIKQKQSL
jgi:hypothetical protein